ncbi:hypothetical protein GS415_03990 [Rhodococcus hoagii]|nr:hypothetical protein [Prescottella equi]
MSRREYTIRLVCAHEGCGQYTFTVADTRREEAEVRARYRANPYRCYRHSKPDEVLSANNPERQEVLVSVEKPHGKFWGSWASCPVLGSAPSRTTSRPAPG